MDDVTPADTETTGPEHHLRPWQWRPGQSGNPKGRPKSSRHRIQEDLLRSFADDFSVHGPAVIARVRVERPVEYLQIASKLLPREVDVQVSAYADADSIAEAFRLALAVVRGDEAALAAHVPHLIEHDDDA
jgi:Family of unknown function (DUF5681)